MFFLSIIVFFTIFISSYHINADIKGSNTAVSIEPFFTFPENPLLFANEMRGFGYFKNGFALENADTACLFNCVYPVSGTVDLNGGTLVLSQDLLFKNVVDLQSWGVIEGNNYAVEFCSSMAYLPNDASMFDNTFISMNNDLTLSSTLTFQGECTIVGNGNTLFLSTDGGLYIDENSRLLLRNITIKDISDGNILCADETSKIILDTVQWYQNGSYTFLNGSMQIVDYAGFFGDYAFIYDSPQTSTIKSHAIWHIFDDMMFCIGRHTADGAEPLYMEDQNAQLRFSNCCLHINQHGVTFTRGALIFDDIIELDDDSTSTLNGMTIGNGVADDDPIFAFDVGASVHLMSSNLVFNTASSNIIKTGVNKSARLKRFMGSNIYLKKDLTMPSMSLESDSFFIPQIALADGVTLEYDDTLVVLPNALFDITSARRDSYTYQLNGGDSISLTKGTFPLNLTIENTGNIVSGNGSISGDIVFIDEDAELIFDLRGFVEGPCELNGGLITLNGNLSLGAEAMITGSGVIDMNDKTLHMPYLDVIWTSTLEFIGQHSSLDLHAKFTLKSTVTISGDVTIEGSGNVLDLDETGQLYLKDNSTLTFKNVLINNLKESRMICESDNCSIIVDNSQINLGSDCSFEKGSMLFRNNVDVMGTYTFTYESTQTSTIDTNSKLHVSDNVKFIIGRNEISGVEPLYLVDDTSVLNMDNCHMYITALGISFIRGTLQCDNDVIMEVVGTTTDKGLELGDGSADDTTKIMLNAGTTIRTTGGILIYNIGNPDGFVSNSSSAQIVRSPQSNTYMKTGVHLSDLTMRLLDTPMLTTPAQQTLNYSNVNVILPDVEFIINGRRYTNSSNLLGGSGQIFMVRGTYPLGTVVSGSSNIIRGNGAIGGPVIFLNSSARLEWVLNGSLIGNMSLNGGIITLSCDMHLGRGTKVSNGTINLQSNSLLYGTESITITQNNYFDGDGGTIDLRSNLVLDATWTFSQNCILDGNGNTLSLGDNGNILVEKGSELRLNNIKIEGISGDNIRCLDNNGTLILDNVQWRQADDFTYELGILEYYNSVDMGADVDAIFAYQSCHTSTIHSNARLRLDPSMTFSYDPIFVASNDLLEFEDESAILALRSATLHTTVTGMSLTKGTISIRGICYFSSEVEEEDGSIVLDEGISLGNRVSADDLYVVIDGGAQLRCIQGSLSYKNVEQSYLDMGNSLSSLRFNIGTSLKLFENLPLGIGYLALQKGAEIKVEIAGKEVVGSIFLVE